MNARWLSALVNLIAAALCVGASFTTVLTVTNSTIDPTFVFRILASGRYAADGAGNLSLGGGPRYLLLLLPLAAVAVLAAGAALLGRRSVGRLLSGAAASLLAGVVISQLLQADSLRGARDTGDSFALGASVYLGVAGVIVLVVATVLRPRRAGRTVTVRGRWTVPATLNLAAAAVCVAACFTTVYSFTDSYVEPATAGRYLGTGHLITTSGPGGSDGGTRYLFVLLPLAAVGIIAAAAVRSRRPTPGWLLSGAATGVLLTVVISQYLTVHPARGGAVQPFLSASLGSSFYLGAAAVVLFAAATGTQAGRCAGYSAPMPDGVPTPVGAS